MLVMYTSPGRLGSILISCFASPSLVLVVKRSRSVSLYISTNEASIWYCMGRRNTLSQWLSPSLTCLSACLFLSIGKHVLGHLQSVQLTSAATWDFLAISCPGFFFIIWSITSYKKLGEGSFDLKLSSPFILWEENLGTYLQPLRTISEQEVYWPTHFPSLLREAGCGLEYLLYSPRNHPPIFLVSSLWPLHRVGLTRPSLWQRASWTVTN